MAPKSLVLFLLFMVSAFNLPVPVLMYGGGDAAAEVPGMFVFGSSLVDSGNNNFLRNSRARADYLPYGIDFPLGPSGRFSNGRNPVDVLGELLRVPSLIPPFADPRTKGWMIIHGVNYASGGSGILDGTDSISGEVMSLNSQISNFQYKTLPELKVQLGFGSNRSWLFNHRHLSKYLFVVGTGGNDYLLNYFATDKNSRATLSDFTRDLISILSVQLKKLYDLGARKFVLFSIQAMGCVPVVMANARASNGSCVASMNEAAILFNSHLKRLAKPWWGKQMPGSSVVYVNSYKIIRDIIDNPIRTGFSEKRGACCELSSIKEEGRGILCRRGGRACSDRKVHVFFDGLHPTDAVNVKIAEKAYGSSLKAEAYPMNVRALARLSI